MADPLIYLDDDLLLLADAGDEATRDFTTYDGYLDELGVIFHEDASQGMRPTTALAPLRPAKQDVGNNPLEIRTEGGDAFAQSDFTHGSQQVFFHRTGRDERKYLYSEGFDISVQGKLTHLHDTGQALANTSLGGLVVCQGLPFVGAGSVVKRGDGAFPGTWTNEDPTAAEGGVVVLDLVSTGDEIYAAMGTGGIHKRDSGGVWAHYSDVQATRLGYVKDRLMAADGRNLYEVLAAGPAPAVIKTLREGWAFEAIFEAAGFIYAAAVSTSSSESVIYRFSPDDSGNLVTQGVDQMPRGQLMYSGFGYLNTAYVAGGKKNVAGGYDPIVYQAVPSDSGALQLVKLLEGEGAGAVDLAVKAFEALSEDVLFGWSTGSGDPYGAREGLALHNLGRDAVAYHVKKATTVTPTQVRDVLVYNGRVLFVLGSGLYFESATKFVPEAVLIPSVADWGNASFKTWETLEVSHGALPLGTSVAVEFTQKHPDEQEWQAGLTSDVTGDEGLKVRLDSNGTVKSRMFDVRVRSRASTDQLRAPEFFSYSVISNPTADKAEWMLTRYVRILDSDRKDDQAEEIFQDPIATRRRIQDLVRTTVSFVEAAASWTARIEDVSDIEPTIPIEFETGGSEERSGFVMQITMRATRDA